MTPRWLTPAGLHTDTATLPVEGPLPPFEGNTGWINSAPLRTSDLRGQVVLVSFWTYTCINWLRQLPYLRAWFDRYTAHGLAVVGVHTPEFTFEHDADNVHRAVKDLRVDYPVTTDDDYELWRAFDNHFWPALYVADGQGRIRHHYFGEGAYEQTEMVLQQLLTDIGSDPGRDRVSPTATGIEAAADWASLRTAENYTGYVRTEAFASPGGIRPYQPQVYGVPDRLALNEWALSSTWTVEDEFARAESSGSGVAYRFHARDVHLVMAPPEPGQSVPYRVLLNGRPPGRAHGADVDAGGVGEVDSPRLYQLIRQSGRVAESTLDLSFLAPGVQLYAFTFG